MSDNESEERIFEIELAKNGRAGCKKCKKKCVQGELRIAKIGPNPFAEGKIKNWHHTECLFELFKKQRASTKRIDHKDDIIGFEALADQFQKEINEKINELNQFFGVKTSSKKTPSPSQKNVKNNNNAKINSNADNLFKTYQEIVEKVALHSSYLEKTAIIKNFFEKGTNSSSGFQGDIEIWCRLLLPGSIKRIYNLQNKQIIKLFSKIFLEDQNSMLEHLEQGDISATVAHFFEKCKKYSPNLINSHITIQKVDKFLEQLSKLTKEDEQINHFEEIIGKLSVNDLKTIIRLLKHDLRMGAGAKHILHGIHPDAYNIFQASKDLDGVVEKCFGKRRNVQNAEIKLLTPVFPMLAEACKSVEYAIKKCPNGIYSEIKYDGERVQLHKQGMEFKYFSRSLKPVMAHKVAHFKDFISKAFPHANDLILDTEILMMDTTTGKPLPFGTLGVHKKAQFENATVCLFVFDCIYYNGENLMNKPLVERKKILNDNMQEIPNHIVFSEMQEIDDEPKKLAEMIVKVLKLGLEGLVIKDKLSKYEPGKRHWLKVKKDYLHDGAMADSADLLVLGSWYGTGQKGGMMSIFLMGCYNEETHKFCTVTKVHTGHDDKTLEKLQTELKMIKISGDSEKVPKWLNCTRTMIPDFVAKDPKMQPVWEITGAEFTQQHDIHTADGISIRFPRITKIRADKNWETATSLAQLKILFKNSKENADFSMILKQYDSDNKTIINEEDKPAMMNKRKNSQSFLNNNKSPSSSKKMRQEEGKNKVNIENELTEIFGDIKAIFLNCKNNDVQRYFLAYGGIILGSHKYTEITHIFHSSKRIKFINNEWPKTVIHLHINWLIDSINQLKLQPPEKYTVSWKIN